MRKPIASTLAALGVAGGLVVAGAATAHADSYALYASGISSQAACEDWGTYGQQHGAWLSFWCTKPNPMAGWQLWVHYR